MRKMNFFLIMITFLLLPNFLLAQTVTPVQDKANNGQLKRMVFNQWDDWQPTPNTNWLGLPKNPIGWFYWRVLHHAYWNGKDKRPWKTGGQFQQNYLSLLVQKNFDRKMVDTTNKMMETNLATALSMTGGIADLPYQLYFENKFAGLYQDVTNYYEALQTKYPASFNLMMNSSNGKRYIEFLDVEKNRIETIHELFVDRGSRMVSYFKILGELQPACEEIKNYIRSYMLLAALPAPQKIQQPSKPKISDSTDTEIVRDLLKNWKSN
ncbi:MAG TPA: hypothetical protein VFI29_13645 [Hanamia sp.]|nr:hypothetical protein [Hanamia sp.]